MINTANPLSGDDNSKEYFCISLDTISSIKGIIESKQHEYQTTFSMDKFLDINRILVDTNRSLVEDNRKKDDLIEQLYEQRLREKDNVVDIKSMLAEKVGDPGMDLLPEATQELLRSIHERNKRA